MNETERGERNLLHSRPSDLEEPLNKVSKFRSPFCTIAGWAKLFLSILPYQKYHKCLDFNAYPWHYNFCPSMQSCLGMWDAGILPTARQGDRDVNWKWHDASFCTSTEKACWKEIHASAISKYGDRHSTTLVATSVVSHQLVHFLQAPFLSHRTSFGGDPNQSISIHLFTAKCAPVCVSSC